MDKLLLQELEMKRSASGMCFLRPKLYLYFYLVVIALGSLLRAMFGTYLNNNNVQILLLQIIYNVIVGRNITVVRTYPRSSTVFLLNLSYSSKHSTTPPRRSSKTRRRILTLRTTAQWYVNQPPPLQALPISTQNNSKKFN